MTSHDVSSLLTIGEFSAATQLSPKALRLYDDERLLRPATVNATNGYRFYAREQIPTARLIRTLREMEVPLIAIAAIIEAPPGQADTLLNRAAQEIDRRYARQKRAFQSGLAQLHRVADSNLPSIDTRRREPLTVLVKPFVADCNSLLQRMRLLDIELRSNAAAAGLAVNGDSFAILVEPLAEEEGRVEMALPVLTAHAEVDLRQLSAASCIEHSQSSPTISLPLIEGLLDAMFDWLDRRGLRACEAPTLVIGPSESRSNFRLQWAYEGASEEKS